MIGSRVAAPAEGGARDLGVQSAAPTSSIGACTTRSDPADRIHGADVTATDQTWIVMTEGPPPDVPGLPPEVLARIVSELGRRGDKVIDCLRTAAVLIVHAREDGAGLRLAESAAYNLREALDAVVEDRPTPDGGIGTILEAWKRYQNAIRGPGADVDEPRRELDAVFDRLERDEERQAFKTRKLLEYIRDQTGVEPLPGEDDPTKRYSRLRKRANDTLHEDGTVSGVAALYDDATAWFVRFFTPPDDRVRRLVALAEQPFTDEHIDELRELALNAHHLRLFFSRLQDAAWLDPLHDAGLIHLPRAGEPWPVAFLVGGAGAMDPGVIAGVLGRLLADANRAGKDNALSFCRDILQAASRLGPAGHPVACEVVTKYPGDHWVQMIAVSIAKEADPTDPIQFAVADAVLGNEHQSDAGHYSRTMLVRLAEGLTRENVAVRVGMVAAKVRRLAGEKRMRYVALDIAALNTDGDDLRDPVLILTQHLTSMIGTARELGLPTTELLDTIGDVPGELGERITCQVLAGASDVDRELKVTHIERRLASNTTTGDDRDLIRDILTDPLSPRDVACWQAALGQPSPVDPEGDANFLGDNWARAWRWSMVLPTDVLEGWHEAIAAVTAQHGEPSASSFDTRVGRIGSFSGRSPYSGEELAALPVLSVAALVSGWRPSEDDEWGVSARELARALETAVKDNPMEWTDDPTAVVTLLREPVYVDHYFRAVADQAVEVGDRAHALLEAVSLVRSAQWDPTPLGRDDGFDYEPDWSVVDTVTVEMVGAFANKNGQLAADIDLCWELVTGLLRQLPDDLPGIDVYEDASEHDGPLNRAINRPYGKALEAALALGGWEHRNQGSASPRLFEVLDEVLSVPGAVGLELRAVLARTRPFIEAVAAAWLDARASDLFGPTPLGQGTFDQTVKWSRATPWFLSRYRAELAAAAHRGAEHAAAWLLIGFLWEEPDYTFNAVVGGLAGDVAALKATAEEMASLIQDMNAGDPMVDRGLVFWEDLLQSDRSLVPAAALVGLGRWTFVDAVEAERWFELMDRTLALTGGDIDMAIEIADRCKETQPSTRGLRMLRVMLGHGEPWERDYVQAAGVEALRAAANYPVDEEFELLRTQLIERGRDDAADIVAEPPQV